MESHIQKILQGHETSIRNQNLNGKSCENDVVILFSNPAEKNTTGPLLWRILLRSEVDNKMIKTPQHSSKAS